MTVLSPSALTHKGIRLSCNIHDLTYRSVNVVHVKRPHAAVLEQPNRLLARPSLQVRSQITQSSLCLHIPIASKHEALRGRLLLCWRTPATPGASEGASSCLVCNLPSSSNVGTHMQLGAAHAHLLLQ